MEILGTTRLVNCDVYVNQIQPALAGAKTTPTKYERLSPNAVVRFGSSCRQKARQIVDETRPIHVLTAGQ
jgi:hypothetical protein